MEGVEPNEIETLIPSDTADYLEPRHVIYAKPLVLSDGTTVDLNEPRGFLRAVPGQSRLIDEMRAAWRRGRPAAAEPDTGDAGKAKPPAAA
jgi:hypothetical protein